MKVCVIQPEYSVDYSLSDEKFQWEMDMLDKCDESMDLIVLPEYSDVPCYAKTKEEMLKSYEKYNGALIKKAGETAKRCDSVLFISALHKTPTGLRNATYAFDRDGREAGHYYKQHITPGETSNYELDSEYSYMPEEPKIIEIDGIRYGFMICYDFYFYEAFSNLARYKPDIIIGCSNQRTDTHQALEMLTRFCAYNTNAYIVRASLSMGADSEVGGCSMVVTPKGEILLNMLSENGMRCTEINPKEKYLKPGGFGNPLMPHWEYLEKGRRPWKYRPAGSAIVPYDDIMSYPRICAHRGFSTVAPENSMPAFGAAVALGAQEIEFDLWATKDGEIVSIHDHVLDRVSTGEGLIWEHTYDELSGYDFGVKFDEKFEGLRIVKFEEILKKFAGQVIMNIHVKAREDNPTYDDEIIEKMAALIEKYDCKKHVYFMTEHVPLQKQLARIAPDIARCMGEDSKAHWQIVDRAIELGCKKVQLFKPYFNQEMIDKAHEHNIRCNVFWSDDPEEAQKFIDMGIDTILTNDYQRVSQILKG